MLFVGPMPSVSTFFVGSFPGKVLLSIEMNLLKRHGNKICKLLPFASKDLESFEKCLMLFVGPTPSVLMLGFLFLCDDPGIVVNGISYILEDVFHSPVIMLGSPSSSFAWVFALVLLLHQWTWFFSHVPTLYPCKHDGQVSISLPFLPPCAFLRCFWMSCKLMHFSLQPSTSRQ